MTVKELGEKGLELDNIYLGDCLEGMKHIPDHSVDCIICDLPYGTTACAWDTIIPFDKLWEQYKRIAKPNAPILLFGSEPFSTMLRMSNFKEYRYDLIWHKNFSGGFVNAKKMPMKYHENISIFYAALPTYNPQFQEYSESTKKRFAKNGKVNSTKQQIASSNSIQGGLKRTNDEIQIQRGKYPSSILQFPMEAQSKRVHPTQKPIDLIAYLIRTYSNEGDTILDNCGGSGTTAIACIREKRHFILFEKDPIYWEKSVKRVEQELRQLTFDF